jgi:hypothetical protein
MAIIRGPENDLYFIRYYPQHPALHNDTNITIYTAAGPDSCTSLPALGDFAAGVATIRQ